MAIIEGPSELFDGRDASVNIDGDITARRVFYVRTDDKGFDHQSPMVAVGIDLGDFYPDYSWPCWCTSIRAQHPQNDGTVWQIQYDYDNKRELLPNPLFDPVVIRWSSENFTRTTMVDASGDIMLNTADLPYPPLEIDDDRSIVNVERNLPFVPTWILQYRNAVNLDQFVVGGFIVQIGQAKIEKINIGERQVRNDVAYYPVSIDVHFRDEGWQVDRPSEGLMQKTDLGVYTECEDEDFNAVREPAMLDTQGKQTFDHTLQAVKAFDVYPQRFYSALGFF